MGGMIEITHSLQCLQLPDRKPAIIGTTDAEPPRRPLTSDTLNVTEFVSGNLQLWGVTLTPLLPQTCVLMSLYC